MSQTWGDDIDGTAGTGTPFSDIPGNLNDKLASLRSAFSGTAFPSSPVAGQPCLRTDRLTDGGVPKLYRYSGNALLGESGWMEVSAGSPIGEEVVDARGTKPTLDQRLDVSMNEDGTLKASTSLNPSQWTTPSLTFTYLSTTSFKVNGDQRDIYKQTRRLKVNLASSVAYTEVVSASYSAGPDETTIQVLDAVLDATLVDVEHSIFLPDWDGKSALSPRMEIGNNAKVVNFSMSPYTPTLNDDILLVDASGGAVSIYLPSVASAPRGKIWMVVKTDGSSNAVTLFPYSTATLINGYTEKLAVSEPFCPLSFWTNGTSWFVEGDEENKLLLSETGQDFVVTGLYKSSPDSAHVVTLPVGIAYVKGRRVVKSSFDSDLAHVFNNNKDTYVDISNLGALTYSEVANGAAAPAVASQSLRLCKVICGASAITSIEDLRVRTPGMRNAAGSIAVPVMPDLSPDWSMYRNLAIVNTAAAADSELDISADVIMVQHTSTGNYKKLSGFSSTVNIAASGANGLDTGTEANSTWYHVWAIAKDNGTAAALLSIYSTVGSITLPAGYTHAAYLGAVFNDGSGNFIRISQADRIVDYTVNATVKDGSFTAGAWTALDVTHFFPPTSRMVRAAMLITNTGSAVQQGGISPYSNGSAGAYVAGSPPTTLYTSTIGSVFPTARHWSLNARIRSGSFYYYTSNAGSTILAVGWEF